MLRLLAELNSLGAVDIGFFVACGVIIAACIAVYFLIPVFNKKQYQEMRDNLKRREVAFKANLKGAEEDADATADTAVEETIEQTDKQE